MTEIIYKKESYAIIGACFEVYNAKGCGFLEPVYHECLAIEFEHQRIPAISKPSLTLSYRGRMLLQTYQPDFVCFERIILELKTASASADEHSAQLLNYLHTTWPVGKLRALPETGIRTHCQDSTHKHKNGSFRYLFLIIRAHSRD